MMLPADATIDQQYHQFSQSDYVEAVEGFTADDYENDEDDADAEEAV